MRVSVALVVALFLLAASGCSTVTRPTKPDQPLAAVGAPLPGLRFDGEETTLREPGMPLSPSRRWTQEVQNYTASSLNKILTTDDTAPPARTTASFDMASPPTIQLGVWKDMAINLTSTLPSGAVVRSKPVMGFIDDPFESVAMTAASVGSTVLNLVGTASLVVLFAMPPRDNTLLFVAIGSLVGGVALSGAQSAGQYLVSAAEERRWSNLYARALTAHAEDIRRAAVGPEAPPASLGSTAPQPPAPLTPSGTRARSGSQTRAPADPSDAPPPPRR